MMTVLVRELRENVKWALLIFVGLMFFAVNDLRNPTSGLLFQWTQGTHIMLMPVAGLAMGIVQTLFELRPDNWAFVVHRPVSRRAIFLAKGAAGLLLLYIALIVPSAIIVTWAAMPGHLATPFQARMVLPMAADILAAGMYYFAAMVLVLRRARWYASRILPLGSALVASALITMFIANFALAVLLILLVQLFGALAAWGAFEGNGIYSRALLPRVALAFMIFPAAFFLLIGIAGASQSFSSGVRWQYYQVDRQGNLLRIIQTLDGDNRRWQVTDPSGRALDAYAGLDLNDAANSDLFLRFNTYVFDEHALAWPYPAMQGLGFRSATPGIAPLRSFPIPGTTSRPNFSALYNLQNRLIELRDPLSHTLIATIGPDGFTDNHHSTTATFPPAPIGLTGLSNRRVLAFPSIAYWMQLDQRKVIPFFTPPPDDPLLSVAEFGSPTNPLVALATHHRLHILRSSAREAFSVPLPADLSQVYVAPSLLPSTGHLLLQLTSMPWVTPYLHELLEYDIDGTPLRTTEAPPLSTLQSAKRRETALDGLAFPLAARPLIPVWLIDQTFDTHIQEYSALFLACMIFSSITCALLTFLLTWRFRMRFFKSLAWTLANVFLGPAGILTMLSLNEPPARLRCHACNAARPITPTPCPRCAAPVAPKDFDGREIFEPADAFAGSP